MNRKRNWAKKIIVGKELDKNSDICKNLGDQATLGGKSILQCIQCFCKDTDIGRLDGGKETCEIRRRRRGQEKEKIDRRLNDQ